MQPSRLYANGFYEIGPNSPVVFDSDRFVTIKLSYSKVVSINVLSYVR